MQSAELIKNDISDELPGGIVTNKTLSQQSADEKNTGTTEQDLFEGDLYVWSLLLVDKENFKETIAKKVSWCHKSQGSLRIKELCVLCVNLASLAILVRFVSL